MLNENISKYTVMLDYYCHPQNRRQHHHGKRKEKGLWTSLQDPIMDA